MIKLKKEEKDIIDNKKSNEINNLKNEEKKLILDIHNKICNFCSEINDFWLISLRNANYFYINDKDEKILKFLNYITYEWYPNNITFIFKFKANNYFSNEYLYKSYYFDYPVNHNIFLNHVIRTERCSIKWIGDFNSTIELLNKRQWKKIKSFFNIFYSDNDSDNENSHLYFFINNILEYYLNIIPSYK